VREINDYFKSLGPNWVIDEDGEPVQLLCHAVQFSRKAAMLQDDFERFLE
jgi:hypothetical protein